MAPGDAETGAPLKNTCQEDSDCRVGRCSALSGLCVASNTSLRSVLLEIIPPSSDERFGGRRFFRRVDPTQRADPELDTPEVLRLQRPPVVQGRINLAGDTKCPYRVLTLTFVPVEGHLGIDVLTYRVTSAYEIAKLTESLEHSFRFAGLPQGVYDVSWEYAHQGLTAPSGECAVVPRHQRGVRIERLNGSVPPLDISSPLTRPLKVMLPWNDRFEGWRVDVIHARTSEPLSNAEEFSKERLETGPDGSSLAVANLLLGEVVGKDYVEPKQERLRLQPPAGRNLPTVLLFLKGLELFDSGVVQIPALAPFDTLVNYQAWVWEKESPETPVPGIASFRAVNLTDLPEGNAQLSLQVNIAENGRIEATLPPGRYNLRVLPEQNAGLSEFDSSLDVWPPPASAPRATSQSGHVISVPAQKSINGKVVLPIAGGATDVIVRALGVPPTGIAQLGIRPQVARVVGTQIRSKSGNFVLPNADCGSCEESPGALFDLRVQPPGNSNFPWLVRPNVEVFDDTNVGALEVGAPYVYERKLEFPAPPGSDGSFPNALIRAYVALDNFGDPVLAENLETCQAVALSDPGRDGARCIDRLVQIAETRSGKAGVFRLLLPPSMDSARK